MPDASTAIDTSANGLNVLRRADFNWALHLKSVWDDQPHHVDGLQREIEQDFAEKLAELTRTEAAAASPLGWVLTGAGGVGKTHLLTNLRAEAARQKCVFILVDMTDVHDFWGTVAIGYTSSLDEDYCPGCSQFQFILRELIARISSPAKIDDNLRTIVHADPPRLRRFVAQIIQALRRRHRREMSVDKQDTIRALVAINSDDFEIANLGQMWLQGLELDPADARNLGFSLFQQEPAKIVGGLSWIISLSVPAVVAFDQLDPIVRQLEYEAVVSASENDARQEAVANSIISGIGDGLRLMYDVTRRSLFVLACLESSWDILQNRVLRTSVDRFEPPRPLKKLDEADKLRQIVAARMQPAFAKVGLEPPYATWPFAESAFASLHGITPRELLKHCDNHRRRCMDRSEVIELRSFRQAEESSGEREAGDGLERLDEQYARLRQAADLAEMLAEKADEGPLADALRAACECLLRECNLPDDVDAIIDTAFTGGSKLKPLHARIRLVFHREEEREEHYAVRALTRNNAIAFQNRLKLATTQSGIDKALSFRHLTLVRRSEVPGGAVTRKLTDQFLEAGGRFHCPGDGCLRQLEALRVMSQSGDPDFQAWLESRKPASQTEFCRQAFFGIIDRFVNAPGAAANQDDQGTTPPARPSTVNDKPVAGQAESDSGSRNAGDSTPRPHLADDVLPLGRKLAGTRPGETLTMPLPLLSKHTVVLAGAGSGKTVLLKRLIEEAALRGIPSIVLDGANDLAALGDAWPSQPAEWSDEDTELAQFYRARVEPVIWTPGKRSGRPLRLELLPDLTATADDADEFDAAIAMVTGALADVLKLGNSRSDQNKSGILSRALRFYVRQGGVGLSAFIELLSDLPADAMLGISREGALAKELADGLRVLEETDPMIGDAGDNLDPAVLFGDDAECDATRVSVINFSFLATDELQQRFVNQLATTLFAWIKQHPNPPGRCLRGLLVIDEAKDLVPARRSTPCKESLIRLTAQARKYHLGVVYATQNPREIENTIIGNCSTQYYGKMNSPAALETVREQLATRGGSGDDVGRLEKGVFYVFNADAGMTRPVKVSVPLCLSHHHTLDAEGVLARASGSAR